MSEDTFEAFIARERERLNGRLAEIASQQQALAEEHDGVERELAAISAYEAVKEGRVDQLPERKGRARRASSAPRAPRGQKRGEILDLIKQHADGLTRGEIIEMMDVKGDRSGEQSISNALSALKKANHIEARDGGKYIAAA